MEIITKQEAIAQGLRHYFTGKPCGKGHLSKRYLQGGCAECTKENTKRRMARIYSSPEKHEAFNVRARAKRRRQWQRHKERYNAERRERWTTDEAYRERQAGTNKYIGYLYRRRKRAAMPPWADREVIKKMYAKVAKMNRLAGRNTPGRCAFHVDHIIPLHGENVCGLHIPANLRIVRASDNIRKGNKWEGD